MELTNEHLNEELEGILEAAEIDETQESRVEQEFAIQYNVITREERLEVIAEDIVSHFMGRGYRGKGMVISIDKATAVKMYDKVGEHWEAYLEEITGGVEGHYRGRGRASPAGNDSSTWKRPIWRWSSPSRRTRLII